MENKRVLFVLSRNPWPSDTGRKGLISYWCRLLNEELHYDVYLFYAGQKNEHKELTPDYIQGYMEGKPLTKRKKRNNLLFRSFFGGQTFQSSLYYSKENLRRLEKFAKEIRPDAVIFDRIRLSPYVKAFKGMDCSLIRERDDLLSKRYRIQLSQKNGKSNLRGNSSARVSGFLNRRINSKRIRNFVLKAELKRTKKWEKKCSVLFAKNVFVSKIEKDEYEKETSSTNGYVVPIGIDFDYFSKTERDSKNHILTFLGNYTYDPNAASVKLICEEVLPHLSFDYQRLFIGQVPEELENKYQSDHVRFLGKVADTREIIGKSALFLAPIAYGTGIKTKIIESMGRGRCVVTNEKGAENIDAENGKDFFVFSDRKKLASFVNGNIDNTELIEKTGDNAKALIGEKYTYKAVLDGLKEIRE